MKVNEPDRLKLLKISRIGVSFNLDTYAQFKIDFSQEVIYKNLHINVNDILECSESDIDEKLRSSRNRLSPIFNFRREK